MPQSSTSNCWNGCKEKILERERCSAPAPRNSVILHENNHTAEKLENSSTIQNTESNCSATDVNDVKVDDKVLPISSSIESAKEEHQQQIQSDDSDENTADKCTKLHFKKIIQTHTDESLGDCSFLNTCFHMSTCK